MTEVQRTAYLENLRRFAGKDLDDETLNTALQFAMKSGAKNILKAAQDYCRNLIAQGVMPQGDDAGTLQEAQERWKEHRDGESQLETRRKDAFHKKLGRIVAFCSAHPFHAGVPTTICDFRPAYLPPLGDDHIANESTDYLRQDTDERGYCYD
jgi:hypothetical protein